jgi:putative ABC transport system permease protein
MEGYIAKLQNKLGTSVTVEDGRKAMEEMTKGVVSSIGVTVFMIMLIFTAVCFITIFNFTSINIHHNKKNYGIYKSTGMTSKQIRLSILYRFLFLTLIGLVIGIPAGLLGGPKLLNLMFTSMGILKFPYSINTYITILVVPLCAAISALSAWMPSRKIVKLNPRALIVE